jgi:ribokinase
VVDVVVLGDANVDIIAHFPAFPDQGGDALASWTEIHCGGSATNTALALARLGISTSLITRLGPDYWALKVRDCLEQAGVSLAGLQRDSAAMTGLMYVIVTPDGERTILGHRGANVLTDPNEIEEAALRGARLFHLSGYALLAEPQRSAALRALALARNHGLTISLDPGMAVSHDALEQIEELLPDTDILLPSLAEAQRLAGRSEPEECAQALIAAGVDIVAIKLGRQGSLVATALEALRVPGFQVQTRDTTGAGDNFDAGLLAGCLSGLGVSGAALLGNALGAMAAARVGAGTAGPGAHEVLHLLSNLQHGDRETVDRVIAIVAALATQPAKEEEPWEK